MRLTSVRARLALWNVSVLALVLVGFGAVLSGFVQNRLAATADADLAQRVQRVRLLGPPAGERAPGFPGEPTPQAPPGMPGEEGGRAGRPPATEGGFPFGPEARRAGGDGQWQPSFRSGRESGPPPPDPPPNDFRRPRLYHADGASFRNNGLEPLWDRRSVHRTLRGARIYSDVTFEGEPYRVLSSPLRRADGQIIGVIQAAEPLGDQQRLMQGLNRALWMLVPLALLVAAASGAFLTGRALKPVREMTQAAAQIGADDLNRRLDESGQDEFSDLARMLNGMIARLQDAFRRLEAAFEQQRRFTGDASHELRTPLTTIKANTSLAMSQGQTLEDYREAVIAADRAADVMARIVQDLLLLARSDAGQLSPDRLPVPAAELLERAVSMVPVLVRLRIRVTPPADGLMIAGDAHQLGRVLVNLLDNAARHTSLDGEVELSAFELAEEVVLEVRDTGEGIPAEHLPHLTERFYRVDKARARAQGGTGLGLSICRSIAEAHGGRLDIRSEPGRGTAVRVYLPQGEGHGRLAVGERSRGALEGERLKAKG
jgi:heavy metal sensor kinase